jgi:glucose/arabinose dehydrogenase
LVYSLGHRNVQGLAWDAAGTLYATEHGPSGEINGWCCHDEVNRIVPGGNYGWPHVIGDQTREGCLPPLAHSGKATWAPGGCGVLGGAATGGAVNGGAATSVGGASGTTSSSGSSASNPTGSRGAAAPTGVTVPPTLLVAGLRGQNLQLFDLQTGEIQAVWFQDRLGRLRNVLVAPDGSVYFCSSNRDGRGKPQTGDDKIYRIRPGGAFRGPEAR